MVLSCYSIVIGATLGRAFPSRFGVDQMWPRLLKADDLEKAAEQQAR